MSEFPEVKDHLVANPDKYTMTTNPDGTVTLRPTWVDNPAEVLQEGTPVNAAFLAKIPEAIDAIDEKVTSQLAEKASKEEVLTIVGDVSDGTPLFAPNTAGMTDTTRNYVNTTDGLVYTHNGTAWVSTGVTYQATGIANGAVTPDKTNFVNSSTNLYDKDDTRKVSGKLLNSGGSLVDYASGIVSHPIPVTVNETYTAYFNPTTYSSNAKAYFYDVNGAFVSSVTPTMNGEIGTFTVPNTASIKTVKFNVKNTNVGIAMFVKGSVYPSVYVPFQYFLDGKFGLNETQKTEVDEKIANVGNELTGKVIVFDGDSIANAINDPQDGWAGRIATNNNMNYTNYAVDGGTITAGLMAGSNPRHWVSRSVSGYRADADYIILEGGTNDADLIGVNNLGTISYGFQATLDDTTFTGAVESTLKQAILKYPGKKIGFIIAHRMGSIDQQEVRRVFFDRIIECCEKWGVPYIDVWKNSYLNSDLPELKAVYFSDKQHLTTAGYELITPMIEKWVKTL